MFALFSYSMVWNRIQSKPKEWDILLQTHGPRSGAFLQSFEWGSFQQTYGREVQRFTLQEGEDVKAICQGIRMPLPLGQSYVTIFRGPIGNSSFQKTKELLAHLAPAIFTRIEFPFEKDTQSFSLGKHVSPFQPIDTWITNLNVSEEDLLRGMHQKTRYNIRLAEKKEVQVTPARVLSDAAWSIFCETGARGDFLLHERSYYETMLGTLKGSVCDARLWEGYVQGVLRAVILTIDACGTRTYLHGASSREDREYMAPFLVHWRAMQDAKAQGLKAYDWWGIAPEGADSPHPWAGISRFKQGFPGERLSYVVAREIPLRPLWYAAYLLAKLFRK